MGRRILALVVKEFLAILRDAKSRIVLVVPPIIQLLVFGYAVTFDLNHVPFAVYDEDNSPASRELLAHFCNSPNFRQAAVITRQFAEVMQGPECSLSLLDPQEGTLRVLADVCIEEGDEATPPSIEGEWKASYEDREIGGTLSAHPVE